MTKEEAINYRILNRYWPDSDYTDEELLEAVEELSRGYERRGDRDMVLLLSCIEKELKGQGDADTHIPDEELH